MSAPFEIPSDLAFQVLEVLRLTHIYALKDSHPEELPYDDFKPWKWTNEVEFAEESIKVYKAMITAMQAQPRFDPDHDQGALCEDPECGHPYYRHFDPMEDHAAIGCKYCFCSTFVEAS